MKNSNVITLGVAAEPQIGTARHDKTCIKSHLTLDAIMRYFSAHICYAFLVTSPAKQIALLTRKPISKFILASDK